MDGTEVDLKKIVIFGATGNTGLCSTETAVEKGLITRVFVRDEKLIPEHLKSKVEVVIGDVVDAEKVSEAVSGMDAVVVVLGTRNNLKPTTVLSEGMKNIIDAMKKHNVKLVSVCLSAFLFRKSDDVPAIFKDLNADHQRMYDLIKESQLKWIAVLPPHIQESEGTGLYTIKHDAGAGPAISKFDLGEFLITSLSQPEHYQKSCGIAAKAE